MDLNYKVKFINTCDAMIHARAMGETFGLAVAEFSKKNKPVIFVSGHFANFELMSMEITKKKIDLATIYRPLNNFFLNPFMEYLRKKFSQKRNCFRQNHH